MALKSKSATPFGLALTVLLLAPFPLEARTDAARASQRDFLLRHYFMGPSETSGWGEAAGRRQVDPGSRTLGPFRPPYFTPEGEPRRGDRTAAQLAAIDLHVEPGRAVVLVGGRPVGRAKRFDGLPRWLWLEPGANELTFVLPDGEEVRSELTLEAGSVLRLAAVLD